MSPKAWSNISREHCCLNRKSSTSTKRIQKFFTKTPTRNRKNRRCEIFFDGCVATFGTITAFVERISGDINQNMCPIFNHKNLNMCLVAITIFIQMMRPSSVRQMTYNGFFGNRLNAWCVRKG